jgi:hypothetical protein
MSTRIARNPYQQRLDEFANSRIFYEPEAGYFEDANGMRCQACGSAAPKHLRLLEDINGQRYLVGQECYLALRKAFSEWSEVKRLGRDFELWIKQNQARFEYKHTWQLVELYKQQDSEDK